MVKQDIRIRMYRVGFGDCFLVSFSELGDDQAKRHLLIDCGVHPTGTLGKSHIQKVVDNIEKESGGNLAIVVASHAHADHVSGFAQCQDSFNRFEIKEIWLPWADDPENEHAQRLQQGEWNLVRELSRQYARPGAMPMGRAARARREAAMQAVANLKQTEPAMNALRSGFTGQIKPKYLRAKDSLSSPGGISGLRVDVLGPPEDDAFIKRMDPPKSDGYMRIEDSDPERSNAIRPFGRWWRKEPADVEKDELFDDLRLSAKEREDIKTAFTEQSFDALAMKLDDVRNNTSLVLLFKFRGKTLLFPGDAQYGNWRSWLDKLDSSDILAELDFLKVSHHGSHNASPKSAIEQLRKGIDAMVSTQNSPFKSIPRPKLVEELMKRTNGRFVRSDSIPIPEAPKAPKGPPVSTLPARFTQGAFWYDLSIPI